MTSVTSMGITAYGAHGAFYFLFLKLAEQRRANHGKKATVLRPMLGNEISRYAM